MPVCGNHDLLLTRQVHASIAARVTFGDAVSMRLLTATPASSIVGAGPGYGPSCGAGASRHDSVTSGMIPLG
jgi:hypothetical protein